MHILVTGAAGHIGHETVRQLVGQGYDVTALDMVKPEQAQERLRDDFSKVAYHQVNITDFDAIEPLFDGVDAVIHLAAIPDPIAGKGEVVFDTNCTGAFNVFQSSAAHGIKQIAAASSINALGNGFGVRSIDVQYLPVDEYHPSHTTDAYSFSKEVLEATAAYFYRREGINSVLLRFPFVFDPVWFEPDLVAGYLGQIRSYYEKYIALPDEAMLAEGRRIIDDLEDMKQRKQWELPWKDVVKQVEAIDGAILCRDRGDFWAILDVRDAARALILGATATYEGSHPLWIVDRVNGNGLPSAWLVDMFYPDVTDIREPLDGIRSLVSCKKAKTVLGWESTYSVAKYSEDSV